MIDVSLHGRHYRTLTADEEADLQELHRWWLSRQGERVQQAWGYDPAESGTRHPRGALGT